MSRLMLVFTTAVLLLLVMALAACGGGGEEKTTQTAATPTVATATAAATEAAATTPITPRLSDGATATVTVGGDTFTFEGGECDIASDETWLAVNIGQVGGESFGLLVGSNPSAPGGARPISGGGVFTDGEIVLNVGHGGSTFSMGGTGPAGQASKVTLAADLKSGEFEGTTLFDNLPMSGSFHC